MLSFRTFTLANGLRTVVHRTPGHGMAVLNLLYQVGSRNEDPAHTGLAHYLEHVMFGGSQNVPSFDKALQKAGGINNAYTTQDVTNYYCKLPTTNLETAFWLESDRMMAPSLTKHTLEVQRKVVIEEFKETQLNKPYGAAWPTLLRTAYHVHPYRWPTIGQTVDHLEKATVDEVRAFFNSFYMPNNAILVVSGDVIYEEVQALTQKWFGPIPAGELSVTQCPQEPLPTAARQVVLTGDVPQAAIYKAYPAPALADPAYAAASLLATLLGVGKSAYLYQALVVEQQLLTALQVFVTSHFDQGLFVISGQLRPGVSCAQVEAALAQALTDFNVTENRLQAAKNKMAAEEAFAYISTTERADALAWATALGNTDYVNIWPATREQVHAETIAALKEKLLIPNLCTTLHYKRNKP